MIFNARFELSIKKWARKVTILNETWKQGNVVCLTFNLTSRVANSPHKQVLDFCNLHGFLLRHRECLYNANKFYLNNRFLMLFKRGPRSFRKSLTSGEYETPQKHGELTPSYGIGLSDWDVWSTFSWKANNPPSVWKILDDIEECLRTLHYFLKFRVAVMIINVFEIPPAGFVDIYASKFLLNWSIWWIMCPW